MAGHERHAAAGGLLRHRARLLGIAGIVADLQRQLLAEHAAGGIEIDHRLFGAVLHLPAEGGFAAGHRTGHRDLDVLCESRRRQQRRGECQANELE
ncbi:hypothetical protein V1282_002009 [Nitrobacteraceae bacterium AZCC 2146]